MLLHKQQSTGGVVDSCFTAWSAVDWRRAPFQSPIWRMYWRKCQFCPGHYMERRTIRHVAECLKLSYGTTHHTISHALGYGKVEQDGCQRPVLTISTQRWNDRVCSGSTQPHLQWSSFERPHRPRYGISIMEQRMSSDDWLLVSTQDCHRCILCWISLQIAWSSQRKCQGKLTHWVLLHNDNEQVDTSEAAMVDMH